MKKSILFIIICFVFLCGMLGLLYFMKDIDKQTEETTVELSVTISSIIISKTGNDSSIKIITDEYDNDFYLQPNITKYLKNDEINTLKSGDIIEIRIKKEDIELLNNEKFVYLISLKFGEKGLISLSEYNNYINISARPARTSCVILALFFSLLIIRNIRKIIKGRYGY